jgi:transposase
MVELCYESGAGGSTMSRQLKVREPNATEMRQLRQMLEESTNARLCRWAEAVLFYGAGLDAKLIADALAVHVNTIYTCLHRFARMGIASLQRLPRQGAPARITAAQVDEIARIAEQSPTEFGLPYGRWSLAKLQDYVIHQRRLLKAISREHLRRVLKKRIFACAMFNANSSATIHSDVRFWHEFGRFGDIGRVTA